VLKSNGARVTGSVSGRTHYLIYGEKLIDGRHYTTGTKYKKAMELKKPMMDENQINEFLKEKTGFGLFKPTVSNVVEAGHMPAAPMIPISEKSDPKPEEVE
jgi:replication factor C subunit 1